MKNNELIRKIRKIIQLETEVVVYSEICSFFATLIETNESQNEETLIPQKQKAYRNNYIWLLLVLGAVFITVVNLLFPKAPPIVKFFVTISPSIPLIGAINEQRLIRKKQKLEYEKKVEIYNIASKIENSALENSLNGCTVSNNPDHLSFWNEIIRRKIILRDKSHKNKILSNGLNALVLTCKNKQDMLQKAYYESGIYGKYWSLFHLTTFYESLNIERCESLEGPKGAYDLFETRYPNANVQKEYKIDRISFHKLKDNNYALFLEYQRAYSVIDTLKSYLQKILNASNDSKEEIDEIIFRRLPGLLEEHP